MLSSLCDPIVFQANCIMHCFQPSLLLYKKYTLLNDRERKIESHCGLTLTLREKRTADGFFVTLQYCSKRCCYRSRIVSVDAFRNIAIGDKIEAWNDSNDIESEVGYSQMLSK